MSKYNILHVCVHEQVHSITGLKEERRDQNWYERVRTCLGCRRDLLDQKARQHSWTRRLTPLWGTDNQIRFGEIIRSESFRRLDNFMEQVRSLANPQAPQTGILIALEILGRQLEKLEQEERAQWWIEYRHKTAATMINEAGSRSPQDPVTRSHQIPHLRRRPNIHQRGKDNHHFKDIRDRMTSPNPQV